MLASIASMGGRDGSPRATSTVRASVARIKRQSAIAGQGCRPFKVEKVEVIVCHIWRARAKFCGKFRRYRRSTARQRCPLYPRKRTLELSRAMSAMCQKRTYALQQSRSTGRGTDEFLPTVGVG